MTDTTYLSEGVEKGRVAAAEEYFNRDSVPVEDEPWFNAKLFIPLSKEWHVILEKGTFEELTMEERKEKGFKVIFSVERTSLNGMTYTIFSALDATKEEIELELNALYLPF